MMHWWVSVGRVLQLDAAVRNALLGRAWAFLAGPVTAVLVAVRLTATEQGYYYTFFDLLAASVLLELGLSTVLVQVISHESSNATVVRDQLAGADDLCRARLCSLVHTALLWYVSLAVIAWCALSFAGLLFLNVHGHIGSSALRWRAPWLLAVTLFCLNLVGVPILATFEGLRLVAEVERFRAIRSVARDLALWLALCSGLGLYSPAIALAASLSALVCWLALKKGRLLASLLRGPRSGFSWLHEVLPFQGRVAVSWVGGYLFFRVLTPMAFRYDKPEAAGRLGMTLTVTLGITHAAQVWVSTKVPYFGMAIACRRYATLDRLFWDATVRSVGVTFALDCVLVLVVWMLAEVGHPLAGRLLEIKWTAVVAVANLGNQLIFSMAAYLRAHKREPLVAQSVVCGLLMAAIARVAVTRFGTGGVATGYLMVTLVALVWVALTFRKCRKAWHRPQMKAEGRCVLVSRK